MPAAFLAARFQWLAPFLVSWANAVSMFHVSGFYACGVSWANASLNVSRFWVSGANARLTSLRAALFLWLRRLNVSCFMCYAHFMLIFAMAQLYNVTAQCVAQLAVIKVVGVVCVVFEKKKTT